MIRIYTDMAADMFHVGHLNLIKRARSFGDYMIVGVHSDKDISNYKRPPIIEEEHRYSIIESCKYVDELIRDAPLIMTEQHLKQQADPIRLGMMKYVPRTEGVSTSAIIEKIQNLSN